MIRTSPLLFWFGLTIAASLALYHTSDRVHELDQQLRGLNAAIDAERQNIHVLRAEWVYLANPARIEATSKRHLGLRPTAPRQIISLADLGDVLPTRSEAMGSVAITGMPIATVKTSFAVPAPRAARKTAVAVDDGNHINNHIVIQHTASAQPLPDSIGALINELNSQP